MGHRTLLVRTNHPSFALFTWVLLGAITGCGGESDTSKPSTSTAAGAGGGSSSTKGSSPRGGSATGATSSTQTTRASGGATASSQMTLGSGGTAATVIAQGGSSTTTAKTSIGGGQNSTSHWGTAGVPVGGQTSGPTGTNTGGASANSAAGRSASGGTAAVGGSSPKGGTAAVGGSSPKGGTSSTATSNQATDAFVTTYANPYCTKLADCCTKAGYQAPSTSACAAHELSYYDKSLLDGTATLNASAVQTLLAAVQNTCDQPSYTLYSNLTQGTLPEGAGCTDVSQCAGDSVVCGIAASATTGTCTALSRGKLGSACIVNCDNTGSCRWTVNGASASPGIAACWDEDGLRCDDTSNTCVALSEIGKSCDFGTCGAHADCYNGSCLAKGKLNESCADGRSCESTMICDGTSQKCVKMSIAWSGSCEL